MPTSNLTPQLAVGNRTVLAVNGDAILTDDAGSVPTADDRAVLTSLLETWEGLQSSKGGSWRSDRELSSWDGVTVDFEGRVTELKLEECSLLGEDLLSSIMVHG